MKVAEEELVRSRVAHVRCGSPLALVREGSGMEKRKWRRRGPVGGEKEEEEEGKRRKRKRLNYRRGRG
jgi:hypothetical protein